MENEINISSEQINSFLNKIGGVSDNSAQVIKESLSPEQKAKLNSILSDPERLRKILTSPQAKMVFNMIKDKKE